MDKRLKNGKVSQAVLERSVLRPLSLNDAQDPQDVYGADAAGIPEDGGWNTGKREELHPSGEKNYAGASAGRDAGKPQWIHTGGGTLGGRTDPALKMYLSEQSNSLAAAGGKLRYLWVTLTMPAGEPEETLRRIMEEIAVWAHQRQVKVCGGHTCVSDGVARPVISLTGVGETMTAVCPTQKILENPKDPFVLVMAGFAGCAGTALLARREEKALRAHFPSVIVEEALNMEQAVCVDEMAALAWRYGAAAMHDISYGGVFGALWELAAREHFGFEADLKKIPIRQETIEICEWYDRNPYELYGQGALLMVMPQEAARQLIKEGKSRKRTGNDEHSQAGLRSDLPGLNTRVSKGSETDQTDCCFEGPLTIIGTIKEGNDKIIRNGDDVRYLDKPQQDAIFL